MGSEGETGILEAKKTKKKKKGKKKNKTILQETDVENSDVDNVPTLGEDSKINSNVDVEVEDVIPSDEESQASCTTNEINQGKLSTPPNVQEEEEVQENILQLTHLAQMMMPSE